MHDAVEIVDKKFRIIGTCQSAKLKKDYVEVLIKSTKDIIVKMNINSFEQISDNIGKRMVFIGNIKDSSYICKIFTLAE